MIIKSWPATASYNDRVRVTDWLLQQAQVQDEAKQEHGYIYIYIYIYIYVYMYLCIHVYMYIYIYYAASYSAIRIQGMHAQASPQKGHCATGVPRATV